MPVYVYHCKKNHTFEKLEKITAPSECKCPECQALAKRVIQPVAVTFKGTGFYKTDSRSVNIK